MKEFREDERVKRKRKKHIENHRWKRDKTKITKIPITVIRDIEAIPHKWPYNETEEEYNHRIGKLKKEAKRRKVKRK